MKKMICLMLVIAVMVMGFAFAESSVTLGVSVDNPYVYEVIEPTETQTAIQTSVVSAIETVNMATEEYLASEENVVDAENVTPLSAFFGIDVGERTISECIEINATEDAIETLSATFTFPVPAEENAIVILGFTSCEVVETEEAEAEESVLEAVWTEENTTWVQPESYVTEEGNLVITFTDELLAAIHEADVVTLIVLQ